MQSIWCLVYVHSVQMQWRQEHTASFHEFFLENIPNLQICPTKITNDTFYKTISSKIVLIIFKYIQLKFVKTISVQCWSRQNQQACSGEQEQRSW